MNKVVATVGVIAGIVSVLHGLAWWIPYFLDKPMLMSMVEEQAPHLAMSGSWFAAAEVLGGMFIVWSFGFRGRRSAKT